MAAIIVRRLNPVTWDPYAGNGPTNFVSDATAVAQIIAQKLRFLQGEWWENLAAGLPLFQQILGSPGSTKNLRVITALIAAQIKSVPYVTVLTTLNVKYVARSFTFAATVETAFGTVYLASTPGSAAAIQSTS